MSKKLEGRVAIVTGSGANIGEACVKVLANACARVVVADINVDGAKRVAQEINEAGGEAFGGISTHQSYVGDVLAHGQ